VQHPSSGDPTLGAVEDKDTVGIALAGELVARPGEDPPASVEIIARAEMSAATSAVPLTAGPMPRWQRNKIGI
jgi:hypothetical protein